MEIIRAEGDFRKIDADLLIVPIFKDERADSGLLAALNELTNGWVKTALESGEASSERNKSVLLHRCEGLKASRLALYGAGDRDKLGLLDLQRISGSILRSFVSQAIRSIALVVRDSGDTKRDARAVVEGALLGQLDSSIYSSNDKPRPRCERLTVVSESGTADFAEAISSASIFAEATNFARELGNEAGNRMTPIELARRAKEMAEREGLGYEELDEDEMKELGMGALLAVSRGSAEPARLMALSYQPENPSCDDVIALVGKGLTFDSGGISIKPADDMDEMKFDMCGGAAVLGAMMIIARLKPRIKVLGVVPSSENLPSGRAYKPGDVLRSYSGKTIEVINTDAEGRLILADAITWAINRGATHVIDIATLTGACVVALGEVRAAVMGNDEALIQDLLGAADQCGERLWQMPLDKEYRDLIRSDIADMKNAGGRVAGAITAAMFLKQFGGSVSWAHLDVAGTAWITKAMPYMAKGATGFGARTLASFVINRASK